MSNYTLFIADAHLESANRKATAFFTTFLASSLAKQANALYILGDLFAAWAGNDTEPKYSATVKTALKNYTARGKPIFLIPGNRDLLLDQTFATATGCTLLADPDVIHLYNKPTLLTHGDLFGVTNVLHLKFRNFLKNPRQRQQFLQLPLYMRKFIVWAEHFYDTLFSKAHWAENQKIAEPKAWQMLSDHHAQQIIHGHFHTPIIKTFTNNSARRYIVLANFSATGSALLYKSNGNCEFTHS